MRLLWTFLIAVSLFGQIPGLTPAPAEPKKEEPQDPLGRETPRSSIMGFLKATQNSRYQTAAQYLQVAAARRNTQGVKLAQELEVLLDTSYKTPLAQFSNNPDGALEEGVPQNQDRMGEITVGEESVGMVMI